MENEYTHDILSARTTAEILNLIEQVDSDKREIKRLATLLLDQKPSPIQVSKLASLKIELGELNSVRVALTTKQRLVKKSEAMARKALNESSSGFLQAFLEAASEVLSKEEFTKIKKRADDRLLATKIRAQTE